jgi:glutaredoxin
MQKSRIILGVFVIAVIGGGVWAFQASRAPSPYDGFAQCLAEKGAVMYGTYWCPYCQKQKELFGRAFTRAKYVECAMPGNPRAAAPACRDAGVTSYPTWIYADGSRTTGVQELAALAEKTGCVLPTTP